VPIIKNKLRHSGFVDVFMTVTHTTFDMCHYIGSLIIRK